MKRECGECTLCCKLLPVASLAKNANMKCQFQKFHKGCSVYNKPKMPIECHFWNCAWLTSNDTADISRPDRAHYVIDTLPDMIQVIDNITGIKRDMPACVIWCDPKYPDAHRDPKLREFMDRRAMEGIVTMVRFNSYDAMIIFAPRICTENRWIEVSHVSDIIKPAQEEVDQRIRLAYKLRNEDV